MATAPGFVFDRTVFVYLEGSPPEVDPIPLLDSEEFDRFEEAP